MKRERPILVVPHARRRARRGFTLVEIVIAAAIVGVVFVALLEAFAVGLRMLEQSQRMTVGAALAEEIHEMTLPMPLCDPSHHWGLEPGETGPPFNDVNDLDGLSFCPPIAASGAQLTHLADYQQTVTVVCVSDTDFSEVVADGESAVYRVSVTVRCQTTEVCRLTWLLVGSP